MRDGTHVFFPARTRSTLRGWSVDLYLCDEAQLLTDAQWESAKPAMSARAHAQVWLFGTCPQMLGDGEVFGRLRRAAHDGTDDASVGEIPQPKRREPLAWVEYGADPGCDLDDRDQWAAANPGRVEISAVEAERRELSPGGFARERLNLWPTDRVEAVFDMDRWAALRSPGPPDGTAPSAIAVDASPDRAMAIAVAWLLEGDGCHVELLDADYVSDPLNALQYVIERAGRRIPVVIDGASPAASMVPALHAQKVKTMITTARDMGRACGGFLDDVGAGRLSHAGQPQLDAAVAGGRRRPIGDAGLWAWDRRDGSVFVAPLVAVTLARHGAVTAGRRRTGGAVFV